ncbi:MAG: FAD-dependent oxidoreductase [Vampirovibrionales bacterium]|nr:FAD-dependent oxidoreductase [Vampirovibrionales bacterium]
MPEHLLVLGDELESVLTAVSAAELGVPVTLARRSTGMLGGLSTRGGLCYMDITPAYVPPMMRRFFDRIGFKRVALVPERAGQAMADMLDEAGVSVLSGVRPETLRYEPNTGLYTLALAEIDQSRKAQVKPYASGKEREKLSLIEDASAPRTDAPRTDEGHLLSKTYTHVIDATPDADAARALGIPYIEGLGEVFGEEQNFLGISPVFRVRGVDWQEFRQFEEMLRLHPKMPEWMMAALPQQSPEKILDMIDQPAYIADNKAELDYLDVLNPAIGIYYHVWRGRKPEDYPNAEIVVDGFNIALLPDGHKTDAMSLNGMVARLSPASDNFETLLAYSHGKPCPDFLNDELAAFERFLKEAGGFAKAVVEVPEELYVRQTCTLLAKDNMTAEKAIRGGVSEEKAIGTYSYWLDLRGTELWKHYPGEYLPKPVFNVGLDVALPLFADASYGYPENFAFVGRSAGYSPIAQGVGRIVQHNAMLGEAIGIACALSMVGHTPLSAVCETQVPQVKAILDTRNGSEISIEGRSVWDDAKISKSVVLKADREALERLRQRATMVIESSVFAP